ncbi:unnamed protein product [Ascophyllum nodosum]
MHPSVDVRVTSQERIRQLGLMRNDLDDVRREIASVIERVELVREDLYGERSSARSTFLSIWWCCRRRDLRNLEDRLWIRLHQLQEKENELHRQRTAFLSLSLRSDSRGESPAVVRQPSPVSPEEAPESPPWQQRSLRPERRQPASIASTQGREYGRPPNTGSNTINRAVSHAAQVRLPVRVEATRPADVAYQPPSIRRRSSRPGFAEDTGSGAE